MQNQSSVVAMVGAVAEAIRTLGSVPSGHFYAQVCDKMDLQTYTSIIGILKRAELVSEAGHVLTWVGPTLEGE
jgi:hypothetical protein